MLHGETLLQSASRIAKEYGLVFGRLYLNGVFPVNFSNRADVAISLAARSISGEVQVDGYEFSKFIWATRPPKRLGENYRRMVEKWSHAAKSKEFLRLNRLESIAEKIEREERKKAAQELIEDIRTRKHVAP
jgi:peptidyl-tRNA hydrolase